MSSQQERIAAAADSLHSWAYEQLAEGCSDGTFVQKLESGAIIANLAVALSEGEAPTSLELFFPTNLQSFLIVMRQHEGRLRPIPRKNFPKVATAILYSHSEQ